MRRCEDEKMKKRKVKRTIIHMQHDTMMCYVVRTEEQCKRKCGMGDMYASATQQASTSTFKKMTFEY